MRWHLCIYCYFRLLFLFANLCPICVFTKVTTFGAHANKTTPHYSELQIDQKMLSYVISKKNSPPCWWAAEKLIFGSCPLVLSVFLYLVVEKPVKTLGLCSLWNWWLWLLRCYSSGGKNLHIFSAQNALGTRIFWAEIAAAFIQFEFPPLEVEILVCISLASFFTLCWRSER